MSDHIKLARPVAFCYEATPKTGMCRLAGDVLRLAVKLEHFAAAVPDVTAVEAWLDEVVKEPLIVEELAIATAIRWRCVTTVVGTTDRHGPLTAKVWP